MASLRNYSVSQQGQTVRVFGDVIDDATGEVIATFGQAGTSFITEFQSWPIHAQIEFIQNAASPYLVQRLLGQWPGAAPSGQGQGGG